MEKVFIVSADDFVLYQPTILNLYDCLQDSFDVTIISFDPHYLGKRKESTRRVIYLSCPEGKRKICRAIDLCINAVLKRVHKYLFTLRYRSQLVRGLKYAILAKALQQEQPTHTIAVDPMPLLAAQQVYGRSHFLSLEIMPYDPYWKKIDTGHIQSVIIQNEERYRFLFDGLTLPVFYIQNAPFCNNITLYKGDRSGLVWAGSIVKEFAVLNCLDFIKAYPAYTLVLKGAASEKTRKELQAKYQPLLRSGSVVINEEYLSAESFIGYLTRFSIGFCFYSWELIKTNFNYQTAPSGKLFMYLAAGVPVVACNIPAFKFLAESGAGVLVDDYGPETLYKAVKTIEGNYAAYRDNAYAVAARFCFDKNAAIFKNYLLTDGKT